MTEWMELNAGLEEGGRDVPAHVQRGIFQSVASACRPHLLLEEFAFHAEGCGGAVPSENALAEKAPLPPLLRGSGDVEGWVVIPQDSLRRFRQLEMQIEDVVAVQLMRNKMWSVSVEGPTGPHQPDHGKVTAESLKRCPINDRGRSRMPSRPCMDDIPSYDLRGCNDWV